MQAGIRQWRLQTARCAQHKLGQAPEYASVQRLKHAAAPRKRLCTAVRAAKQQKVAEAGSKPKPNRSGEPDREESSRDAQGSSGSENEEPKSFNLDDFNPLSMGRRSRRIFDDVWTQFAQLASPLGSRTDEDMDTAIMGTAAPTDFDTPEAPTTRVLVVGATGRVGRVLVRKLLLRGYTVSALVRDPTTHNLPQSVTVFQGDLADYDSCRRALQGVDKVIYCAGARTSFMVDQKLVSEHGVQMIAKAFQDIKNQQANKGKARPSNFETAKRPVAVKQAFAQWQVTGLDEEEDEGWGMSGQKAKVKKWARPATQRNYANAYLNARQSLVFEGTLASFGSHASVGSDLPTSQGKPLLANCEGITMRVASDGQPYQLELTTGQGHMYSARFSASSSFTNVRLPFNAFRPERGAPLQFDPADACHISIRRNARPPDTVLGSYGNGQVETNSQAAGKFHLEVLRIKALPGGEEADFVLVSCAGKMAGDNAALASAIEKSTAIKRAGEMGLRRTGLGYTIVRPAELIDEPGGYKALLFDQGNRIRSGVSCVDVADVCLRALHNSAARNKTFEVAHEAPAPLGMGGYELVAHLPDKANDYLGPALASMEKNL